MKLENYLFEESIGKGAFGEVYLTSLKDDPKKYATKKILREEVEQSEAMKYLRNEIAILQYLNHPNIVKFKDVKKTKKNFYIIMEYCNGGELSQALKKYIEKYGKPFDEKIIQHFMKQIIDAFKYIHEKKIIHRSIKLDNILLNYENEEDKNNFNLMKADIKIIDFGFACKVSKEYIKEILEESPITIESLLIKEFKEISSNKKIKNYDFNDMTDIFSIGTICYEMLIGKTVFDSENMDELIKKIEEGIYTIPTNLSYEAISFLNGMLQYDSKKRLTAEQLSKHDFLNKDIKDFHNIDLEKVSKIIDKNELKINLKNNEFIWSIFNADSEKLLNSIEGKQLVNPIEEKDEKECENLKKEEPKK